MSRPLSELASRVRLAVVASVIFLLVLALAIALPLWVERQEIRRLEEHRLHTITQNLMLNVSQQLDVLHRSLTVLRQDLAIWLQTPSGQLSAQRRLTALTDAIPGLLAIRVIDPQGQIWVSHEARPDPTNSAPLAQRARLWVQTPLRADDTGPASVRVAPPNQLPAHQNPASIELWLSGEAFRLPLLASRLTEDTHLAVVGQDGEPLTVLPETPSATTGTTVLEQVLSAFSERAADIRIQIAKSEPPEPDDTRLAAMGAVESSLTQQAGALRVIASRDYDDLYDTWWDAVHTRVGLYLLTVLVVIVAVVLLRRNWQAQQIIRDQALARQRLFASIVDSAHEGILITDKDAIILDVNAAMTQISGYSRDALIGQNPRLFQSGRHTAADYAAIWQALADQGHWYGELWNRRANDDIYPALVTISAVRNAAGVVENYAAIMNDITALKAQEEALQRFAHQDGLTGLPNRRALDEALTQALSRYQHEPIHLAVIFIDLDGFKAVNDRYGHALGDQLLHVLAQRMRARLRADDLLARLGGDEFIAMLIRTDQPADFERAAERLLQAVAEPVDLDGITVCVSASLGVAVLAAETPTTTSWQASDLLRTADAAMYEAKQSGKNRIRFRAPRAAAPVDTPRNDDHYV